jgi:hypothetical protein
MDYTLYIQGVAYNQAVSSTKTANQVQQTAKIADIPNSPNIVLKHYAEAILTNSRDEL